MNLRAVSLNHRSAPIEIREQLAFSPAQVAETLSVWQDTTTELEAVLLSTCNRTEFYVASENGVIPSSEALLKFLLAQKKSPELGYTLASQITVLEGAEVVEHLFSVTASLDSMVLGEAQIPAQVKEAYQLALDAETVGPLTHGLFQSAMKTAKEVAAGTELHRHRVSIPSVAVADFALRIFERLDDKKILLFGAGEMGRETLQYLADHGAQSMTVLNRSRLKAEDLATAFDGKVVDWDRRFEAMTDADIIVSTTGAPETVITLEDYRRIESRREGRTLFVLDLAVPRDFEAAIGDCSGVYLYSIDDLKEICDKNREERNREIPKAEKIVAQAARNFVQNMNHRQSGEVIQLLRQRWSKTRDAELQRLFHKLPELDDRQRDEISYAFERLLGKFLHPPMESLRDESRDGVPHKLLEALARLFRLKDN